MIGIEWWCSLNFMWPKKLGLGIFNWTIKRKNWFDRMAALILCILAFAEQWALGWRCWKMWNTTLISEESHYYGFYLLQQNQRRYCKLVSASVRAVVVFYVRKLDPSELRSVISSHIGQCTIGAQWNWSWLSWVIEFVVVVGCRFFLQFRHSLHFQQMNDCFISIFLAPKNHLTFIRFIVQ